MNPVRNNDDDDNSTPLAQQPPEEWEGAAEQRGASAGTNQGGTVSPSVEEDTAAALAPRRRAGRAASEAMGDVLGDMEGFPAERCRTGNDREVIPQQRQQAAGEEPGGTTRCTARMGKSGNNAGCRRRGEGAKQRLLLSCSHVFHKAVSQLKGFQR